MFLWTLFWHLGLCFDISERLGKRFERERVSTFLHTICLSSAEFAALLQWINEQTEEYEDESLNISLLDRGSCWAIFVQEREEFLKTA